MDIGKIFKISQSKQQKQNLPKKSKDNLVDQSETSTVFYKPIQSGMPIQDDSYYKSKAGLNYAINLYEKINNLTNTDEDKYNSWT